VPKPPKPTNSELAILRVLWKRGPSTVRQVQDGLERGSEVGYTTILKLLQIMAEKGLVERDASGRTHVYSAFASEAMTQRHLVSDLLDRAFGGSALGLVQQALAVKRVSPQERDAIRRLLDQQNEGKK
jgi:predicted transcriptional regulator